MRTYTFILIPGAGGSAWYWHLVAPKLQERGHEAVPVELPAADDRAGLRQYADTVIREIGTRDPNHMVLVAGLEGLTPGDDIIIITWLHRSRREVLRVHPRSDQRRPLTGVFATRSPDRPNPIGLHRVNVRKIVKNRLRIGPIEAIDGTPVIDIKPVLSVKDF